MPDVTKSTYLEEGQGSCRNEKLVIYLGMEGKICFTYQNSQGDRRGFVTFTESTSNANPKAENNNYE